MTGVRALTSHTMMGTQPSRGATCSIEELNAIITAPSGGLTMLPNTDMDEVYPGLFVGDE